MQLIFDNLIAVIVSATLAVLLIGQQASTRQDTLERQSVHAAKTQALVFSEWLEDDIVKLGARFGEDRNRFTFTRTMIGGLPFTTMFQFSYNERVNGDRSADRVEVRYTVTASGSIPVALATPSTPARSVPTYRLERAERSGRYLDGRWVDGNLQPTAEPVWAVNRGYGSPAGLTYFYLDPRTSDGQSITDPNKAADADYVHAQFGVLPSLFPVYRARFIRETGLSWATTVEIRPF